MSRFHAGFEIELPLVFFCEVKFIIFFQIIPYFHLHINNDLCYQIKISLYQLFLSPIHHLPKTKMNLWFVRINLSMKSLTIYQIWIKKTREIKIFLIIIKKNSWNQKKIYLDWILLLLVGWPNWSASGLKKKLVKSKFYTLGQERYKNGNQWYWIGIANRDF